MPPVAGDKFADFTLLDHTRQTWQLSPALDKGALALVFYRGDW
jgi:peroxiredoxin